MTVNHTGSTRRRCGTAAALRVAAGAVLFLPSRLLPTPKFRRRYSRFSKCAGRFLDAHEIDSLDFCAVSRPGGQTDRTQEWTLHFVRNA
jgi:hypothetical protein